MPPMLPLFKFHSGPLKGLLARLTHDDQSSTDITVRTYDGREFTIPRADLYAQALKLSD